MGKIWLKTRYDEAMGMEIPHNWNFANAMYGFKEMGAEIILYHHIGDILDEITKEDIALDYIDQCKTVFYKFGATPKIPDYPVNLAAFLGRKVWKDTINSISSNEEKWSAGYFVKPVRDKAFTGKIISSISDLVGCGNSTENYEVIVSEPLDILAEWRGFILYDELVDVRPYGLLLDQDRKSYRYHYDSDVIDQMMKCFVEWEDRPAACSMDICCTKDGRTLLVEMNDAFALGCYGLSSVIYAKLISARWSQILDRADEFKF